MPAYNAATTLSAAIDSVQRQTGLAWELLVIDGGSTDNTTAIIDQLAGEPNIRCFSEPDLGIYDAMNKGINRAKGDWLYFLGADDQLMPQALTTAAKNFTSAYKVVFGDVQFENGYRMQSYLGPRTWLQNTLHHQAAFYHRSIFDDFRYDLSLQLLADYELNLLVYQHQWPVYYTGQLVAMCHSGGASSNWTKSLKETNIVRKRFLKQGWKQALLSTALFLYYGQKRLRRKLYGHKI
ncbi:glycosyltransferase [Fibrella sp. HMF5335]|uniref:Glycosyltransferase n=2 Tax=Fibrella rubiginis TaxID=2817060 RepID=A0A939GJI2_9BACT|nr:glycosyltransferase [Fibrella rubiginis]